MATGTIQQQQLQRFFEILKESKLFSELEELQQSPTLNHFLSIQQGNQDARRISIPMVRGKLGTYDASTQTPLIGNSTAVEGDSYIVSVGGTVDFGSGNVTLKVGDVIEFRAGQWRKSGGGKKEVEFHTDFSQTKPDIGRESILYVDLAELNILVWKDDNYRPIGGDTSGFEPSLGNPSTDGMILSSDAEGNRRWVTPPTGTGEGVTQQFVEDYVDNNAVKYSIVQSLTDEQKQQAQTNIGVDNFSNPLTAYQNALTS